MSAASEAIKKPQPWYRRIKPWQFSLRTLLVVMAIASAVCWYYLLPEQQNEKLAGGYLILQRQYRGEINTNSGGASFNTPIARTEINDGYWRIKDLEGNLLVNGNFRRDVEHGWWTTYHPSGRVAVQGKMHLGGRTGVWKNWSAAGQLLSEVNHAASKSPRSDQDPNSVRQGPAKFWHAGGKLAVAGSFENDERHGPWEEWNERGELISSGKYAAGKKTGEWREHDSTCQYVNGVPKEQFDAQLQQLADRIENGDVAQQLTLLSVAVEYGEAALPLLQKWAANADNPQVQLAAIMAVVQGGGKGEPFETALAKIIESSPQLSATARWESYRLFSHTRKEHLQALLQESRNLASGSPLAGVDLLRRMFGVDPPNQGLIFGEVLQIMRENMGPLVHLSKSDPDRQSVSQMAGWHADVIPFLDQTLSDSRPENRRAAVMLIRQLLAERNEFVAAKSPAYKHYAWQIPPQLRPLIERARSDTDANTKEMAENVDKAYYRYDGSMGAFNSGSSFF